nr:glycosyltransferase [Paenibacillus sp. PL91]
MIRVKSGRKQGYLSTWNKGFQAGNNDGLAKGWNAGYRLGRSQGIFAKIGEAAFPLFSYKVLYVTAGIGDPYPALDQAIIDALSKVVTGVFSMSPADSVVAAAELHQPDIVLVLNGVSLSVDRVDELRARGFRTAVWFTDDPYYTEWTVNIAPHYDVVFTLELNCVPFYQSVGCKQVYYLPFAVSPKLYQPTAVEPAMQTDICFIGTAFWNRVRYIDQLTPYLLGKRTFISGLWWDRLKNYRQLSSYIKLGEWMPPEETARYYNGAKMVINLHRPVVDEMNRIGMPIQASSVNPRTFEINGCATLQLVDARSEVAQMYEPDKEIVIFHSPEELRHKLEYYLTHEEERREIALSGYKRTLQQHTYVHRLHQMIAILIQN